MRRVLTDPLLLFALLGGLLFVAWLILKGGQGDLETIEVSPETIAALVQRDEDIRGQKITPEERQQLIDSYIDDEVLLREARKSGLAESDGRVRQRLLGVMRYGLLENVPEPSRQQLEAHYNENRDDFLNPASMSFDQVFFGWESEKLPEDPKDFLEEVRKSEDPVALGDRFGTSNEAERVTREALVNGLGAPFADAVEALEPGGGWQGPIESTRGIHYVRLLAMHEPELTPFEMVEPYLRQDWQFIRSREAQQKKIDEMRKRYRIVIEEGVNR